MQADERPNSRGRDRSGGGRMNPLFIGIIAGLLVGVGLAVGAAWWLDRNTSQKVKPIDPLAPKTGKAELPNLDAPKPGIGQFAPPAPVKGGVGDKGGDKGGDKAGDKAGDKPRFEFYKILPGEKGDKGAAQSDKSADTKRDKPTESAAASGKEIYMLQAGAFQSESDADALKAKIAFAGMEATVKPVNLPDKGTLYRVRIGPFRSVDEVNRVKTALAQNGVIAVIVRPE
jgi:SPOR domain